MLAISAGSWLATPHRLFLLLAVAMALLVTWLYGRRERLTVQPMLTQMLLYGALTARAAFVVINIGVYWQAPWRILDIQDGGFIYEAGAAAVAFVALYHGWRQPLIRATLGVAFASALFVFGASMGFGNAMIAAQPQVDELMLSTLDGDATSLSALYGKPAVVNLWATWCPPCRREMPVLAEAQQRDQNVEFVFVNQGEPSATIARYLHSNALQLKNVFLDPQKEWSHQFGADAMPTTLFFDANGALVASHIGELSSVSLKQTLKRITNPTTGE